MSKIEIIDTTKITRGKRANLVSFYCQLCCDIHENYDKEKTYLIGDYLYCERINAFANRVSAEIELDFDLKKEI